MLSSQLSRFRKELAALDSFLQLYESLENGRISSIATRFSHEDRVFRHCAIITKLYSLWEGFVEEALASWLMRLPKYFKYSELSQTFRNNYRCSMGTLVHDIDRREFGYLNLENVVKRYADSLGDVSPYTIITEAFTMHKANIRKDQLVQMFNSVEIQDLWGYIEKDHEVQNQKDLIDSAVNAENLLNDFVNYRNDASHGSPAELLGVQPLRHWILFINALCNALNRALTHETLKHEMKFNQNNIWGKVTEVYSNNIIVLQLNQGKSVRLGDNFYFFSPNSYIRAEILSLQLDDADRTEILAALPVTEVGIKLSSEVHKDSTMLSVAF